MRKKVKLRLVKKNESLAVSYAVVISIMLATFLLLLTVQDEEKPEIVTPVITMHEGASFSEAMKIIGRGDKTPEKAKEICLEIEERRDRCLFHAAKNYNKPEFCSHTKSENYNDICFMYFIVNYDYDVCENIQKSNIRASCSALKRLREVDGEHYV